MPMGSQLLLQTLNNKNTTRFSAMRSSNNKLNAEHLSLWVNKLLISSITIYIQIIK